MVLREYYFLCALQVFSFFTPYHFESNISDITIICLDTTFWGKRPCKTASSLSSCLFIPLPIPTDALEHQIVCKVDGILCGLVNKQLLSTYTFTIQIVVLFCLSSKLQQPHGKHASSSYVDILKTIAILPCAVSCGLIQIYFVRSINKIMCLILNSVSWSY